MPKNVTLSDEDLEMLDYCLNTTAQLFESDGFSRLMGVGSEKAPEDSHAPGKAEN